MYQPNDAYLLWLKWYPRDYEGATAAASDHVETAAEVDALEDCLRTLAGL